MKAAAGVALAGVALAVITAAAAHPVITPVSWAIWGASAGMLAARAMRDRTS